MTEITDDRVFAESEKEIVVVLIGLRIVSLARRTGGGSQAGA